MLVLATKRARVIQREGGEGEEGATTINILFVSVLMASRWTLGGQFPNNARREKTFIAVQLQEFSFYVSCKYFVSKTSLTHTGRKKRKYISQ